MFATKQMFIGECTSVQIMCGNADDFQYLVAFASEYSQQLGHNIEGRGRWEGSEQEEQ